MYLLDTNICIYIINHRPESVEQHLKSLKRSAVHLSTVSLAEMEYGAAKSSYPETSRRALHMFASAFDVLAFDDEDAEMYGIIRWNLENKGCPIGPYDMQIAAQALSKDLILVTNNVKEFERIPHLKIENWVSVN